MAFISSLPVPSRRGRSSVGSSVLITGRTLMTNCAQSVAPAFADTTSDLQYNYVKKGSGPSPEVGDLVGIRFKGAYNGVVFDNLFESPEPYFYRAGSGTILQGIDEAVLQMKVGDVVDVTLPGEKAFGQKGRRASAGKPSIPPNASISYTIELTTIPGKEDELLQGIDDSEIESSE